MFGLCKLLCMPAQAEYAISSPRISGFLNAGLTNNDNKTRYLGYKNSVEFQSDTLLGVQVDSPIDESIRVSAQGIAKDTSGNFDIDTEWAYVAYTIIPQLEIKAGRLRVPNFLFSETIHVGASYPWLRPPPEVYNMFQTTRLHGVDFTYSMAFKEATLYLQPYAGEIHSETNSVTAGTDDFFGMRTRLETPNFEYIASFIHASGFFDITVRSNDTIIMQSVDFGFEMFTLGLATELGDYQFLTEFSKNQNTGTSSPDARGWYGTLVYHTDFYAPYVTLAMRDEEGTAANDLVDLHESQSVSLGIRFDLTPGAEVTFELQHAEANNQTSGLFGDPLGLAELPEDNQVNLFSVRFDTVF